MRNNILHISSRMLLLFFPSLNNRTRCPICRESFAHKLERRTLPRSKKPPGKQ